MHDFVLSAFGDEIADDLTTQMDVLERCGISHIEMRGVNGRPLIQNTLEETEEIAKMLRRRGFHVSCVASPIGKISITEPFEPHLALFRHALKIAGILETKFIRMFSFYIPKNDRPESHRNEVIRRWSEFVHAAEGSGAVLLHENEKEIFGDTPERCLELIKTMNSDLVNAVFDPANFVQCGVETFPHAFELLKDHIAYVHIKDALKASGGVVPAGQGDGRIGSILRALKNRGYSGFLSLEPHLGAFTSFTALEKNPKGFNQVESGAETFVIAFESLKKVMDNIH